MMSLVRKHISEHRSTGRPPAGPTAAIEFRHPPLWTAGQRIRQHEQTLLCALRMRRCRLLDRAPIGIKPRRTLQVWGRPLDPNQPAVVQMRKDGRNRPPTSRLSRGLRPPGPRIQMPQQMLIDCIVDGVGLYQDGRKVGHAAIVRRFCTFDRSLRHEPSPLVVPMFSTRHQLPPTHVDLGRNDPQPLSIVASPFTGGNTAVNDTLSRRQSRNS